jgi:hypothetical protein
MLVFQIIYLVLNVVCTGVCLVALFTEFDLDFVFDIFSFVENRLGTVIYAIFILIVIALFLPTIMISGAIFTFLVLFNSADK